VQGGARVTLYVFFVHAAWAQPDAESVFESQVRPLLVKRCAACHSAKLRSGGLALDSREAWLKGGDSGTPAAQAVIKAVRGEQPFKRMPFGGQLAAEEIQVLERWVAGGAQWPASPEAAEKKKDEIWSFQPVRPVTPPTVRDTSWPRTDIDRFILAKLEEKGMKPAPDADKRTLVRRVFLDLTGLPPTAEDVRAFVSDTSPNAYAALVDRLLTSPRYGERWGRHWLDVARYADTSGDAADYPIPQAYLYRDWVIQAFNQDLPYNEFLRYQLAGDILAREESDPARYKDKLVATGFIALAHRFGNKKGDLHLTIEDTIDTLGRGVLGLTLRCARCHDHKFDPMSVNDYYGMYGIFASTRYPWAGASDSAYPANWQPLSPDPGVRAAAVRQFEQLVSYVHQINDNKYVPKPVRERWAELMKGIAEAEKSGSDTAALVKERDGILKKYAEYRDFIVHGLDWLKQERDRLGKQPLPCELAFAVSEGEPRDAAIQRGGDPARPGKVVARQFVESVWADGAHPIQAGSGRLQLADWIVDPHHPLTRRVFVNRVWQWHFGRGIVGTPDNFGHRGEAPTHPELLDYLATAFQQDRWSLKALHRRILMSRVYQLSSEQVRANSEQDPAAAFLWRFPPRRLDAESIRDSMLAVSGDLDLSPAGPHPIAPWWQKKWNLNGPFHEVYEHNHRTVYLITQRLFPQPYLELFDGADTNQTTAVRDRSNLATQALYLLNSPFVAARAASFGKRIEAAAAGDDDRIRYGFETAYGRLPRESELRDTAAFLKRYQSIHDGSTSAWTALARALLSSNEFFFLN
jgi:hypothetical protein